MSDIMLGILLNTAAVSLTVYLCVNVWWTSKVRIAEEERKKAEAEYGSPTHKEADDE